MSGENASNYNWDPNSDPMLDLDFDEERNKNENVKFSERSHQSLGLDAVEDMRDVSPGKLRNSPITTLPLKVLERMNSDNSSFLLGEELTSEQPDSDRPTHRSEELTGNASTTPRPNDQISPRFLKG